MESNIKDKLIKEEEIKKLENLQKKQNRKTPAKAAGLKSIMIAKDKVILAAYGKGNDTIIEKIVKSNKVESIADPKHFDAKILHNKTKKAEKKETYKFDEVVSYMRENYPKTKVPEIKHALVYRMDDVMKQKYNITSKEAILLGYVKEGEKYSRSK